MALPIPGETIIDHSPYSSEVDIIILRLIRTNRSKSRFTQIFSLIDPRSWHVIPLNGQLVTTSRVTLGVQEGSSKGSSDGPVIPGAID